VPPILLDQEEEGGLHLQGGCELIPRHDRKMRYKAVTRELAGAVRINADKRSPIEQG